MVLARLLRLGGTSAGRHVFLDSLSINSGSMEDRDFYEEPAFPCIQVRITNASVTDQ